MKKKSNVICKENSKGVKKCWTKGKKKNGSNKR